MDICGNVRKCAEMCGNVRRKKVRRNLGIWDGEKNSSRVMMWVGDEEGELVDDEEGGWLGDEEGGWVADEEGGWVGDE